MTNTSPNKIVLEAVTELPVPSFKNRKRVTPSGGLITDPAVKARLNDLTDAFVCALLLAYQTAGGATSTGCSLQSWIASCLPKDDCWTCVPEIIARAELAEKPSVRIEIEEIE